MDQKRIARQMIDFNKMAFSKTSQAIVLLQDQTEKLVFHFMDKGKKVMGEWLNAYKKGLESFRDCTDENYERVADYFAESSK